MGPQEHAFRSGVDVIIATPGRLLDHFRQPYAKLAGLEYLVLDEADRMLDMGFLPDIRRVLRHIPAKRQTLFFSATMPPPIATLIAGDAARSGDDQHGAEVGAGRRASPRRCIRCRRSSSRRCWWRCSSGASSGRRWSSPAPSTGPTGSRSTWSNRGSRRERIHGNRSQAQRTEALAGFKSGKYRVLVATDIAARGIDIEALGHVVNFDVPHLPEDYIHRVGRTARAEATGDAFTFVAPEEEGELRQIERAVGNGCPA